MTTWQRMQALAFVGAIAVSSVAGLVYVYVKPLPGLDVTREGVPFFSPRVINPVNGEPIELEKLVRHFKRGNAQ